MIFKVKNKIIQYCPTPKCGCTSTKVMICKGLGQTTACGDDVHVKHWTKTFEAVDADIKFCIVRDPVSRFLSGYSNRVCHYKNVPFVEFNDFVVNFHEKYYKVNKVIHHHFRPQVDFIGHDPSYYNRVFFLDEMPSVCKFLSEIMGSPIKLEKLQVVGAEKPIPTESQINFIKSFYEDDYKFLEQIKR